MRNLRIGILFCSWVAGVVACHGEDDPPADDVDARRSVSGARQLIQQVPPSVDLRKSPADATKTPSGIAYKKLAANEAGGQPKATETAVVQYTGWRPRTGETFFTTKGSGQPIAIDIAHAAPGFREVLPLLHKGEKVALWVPPSKGTPEAVVYEVELVDIVSQPSVRPNAKPMLPGGVAKASGGGAQIVDGEGATRQVAR